MYDVGKSLGVSQEATWSEFEIDSSLSFAVVVTASASGLAIMKG